MSETRSILRIVPGERTVEGGGFVVRRPFPTRALDSFDPFLLLDEMGPADYAPGEAKGAPDHPHRGFETVTYLLEGAMRHRDSQGNSGELGPGDVQWMTAGSGVIHSEMPDLALLKTGGRMHGFQLWVNLPKRDKMIAPRYQDTPSAQIPVATSADGRATVKVIAGEALGAHAVIDTRTPIFYFHVTLTPGGRLAVPAPKDYNAFVYVVKGSGAFGRDSKAAAEGDMVIFATDGDTVDLASHKGLEALVVGGIPLREPVARYGPFVMNTRAEILKAVEDFESGRFGKIGQDGRDQQ
jgi:redox-sensitive bicupin YhaK (pirin superfamily)